MDEVEIVNYDQRWPSAFDEEAKWLPAILHPSLIVEVFEVVLNYTPFGIDGSGLGTVSLRARCDPPPTRARVIELGRHHETAPARV
jgi:hypothetical protein